MTLPRFVRSVSLSFCNWLMTDRFYIPKSVVGDATSADSVYLCGHSLGLQPKGVRQYVEEELKKWETHGVEGHFEGARPWWIIDEFVKEDSAKLIGAQTNEVVVMNSLSMNLHVMMTAFYRPNEKRSKILIEEKAFPSDLYAVVSQAELHGRTAEEAVVLLKPKPGCAFITNDDVVEIIEQHADSLQLILLPAVQYIDGTFFDMERITRVCHEHGIIAGWDLAHAVGNIPLLLHDWKVDFACWCTYKYLNSGPGNLGWWGHKKDTRFAMPRQFDPLPGAAGFAVSNPPVLPLMAMRASLDLYAAAGMSRLRVKSTRLTAYMEYLIQHDPLLSKVVKILTPSSPAQRGAMLCLEFTEPVEHVHKCLAAKGVICDLRKPNVMRASAVPLYNTFSDVFKFVARLRDCLEEVKAKASL